MLDSKKIYHKQPHIKNSNICITLSITFVPFFMYISTFNANKHSEHTIILVFHHGC